MVATENGLMYIVVPGDPLRNFRIARHFFGDDFKVFEENVLVQVGRLFDAHIRLQNGEYQTYLVTNDKFVLWVPLQVLHHYDLYRLSTSKEVWCNKKLGENHIYCPDETSRILFEKYFGIR